MVLTLIDFLLYFLQLYLVKFFVLLDFVHGQGLVFFLIEQPRKLPESSGCLLVLIFLQFVDLALGNPGINGRRLLGVVVVGQIGRV